MQLLSCRLGGDNCRFFCNCNSDTMDYRQKMIVPPQQHKMKHDEDDDDDVEALRLAALKSLKARDGVHTKRQPLPQKIITDVMQISHPPYKSQRSLRRGYEYFHNRSVSHMQHRQNGNLYYQSPRNPNLIAIVPVDERSVLQQTDLTSLVETTPPPSNESYSTGVSKFHRFKDNGSGSDEDDNKEQRNVVTELKVIEKDSVDVKTPSAAEDQVETTKSVEKEPEEEDHEGNNDDDDDVLLMADLEEEDSLERLMDEMEREMNVDKSSDRREKRGSRKEGKESVKKDDLGKNAAQRSRTEDNNIRKESSHSPPLQVATALRNERRSISPHTISRVPQRRRSLSPRSRSRKKSPRRSPRRSPPVRQLKKSQREPTTRYRSPRKSPVRYSPRSRSPKMSRSRSPRLSPRRSPNKSPTRRSPIKTDRRLSPRGRSPKLSPHSRSPRRSPKMSKSPRSARSRSPKFSPLRSSRSPKASPRRTSPSRRLSPKSKSPGLSPRRGPSRLSPKMSPRRPSPRARSPRPSSPRGRSPWSSPRNSPRLSPKRKRSPRWSPKESSRKHPRSTSPDRHSPLYAKDASPTIKSRISPEVYSAKTKHDSDETVSAEKETVDVVNDPVLEARRKKFESTMPIDPINANKKIKLSKKENTSKKMESYEVGDVRSSNARKTNKVPEDYDVQETDLCLDTHYEFEDFEETVENASPIGIASSVDSCIDLESQNPEKERSLKKKKKRDKELYQVGKLKGELPLSERIGKDKKCKKRKDHMTDGSGEDVEAILEDLVVDKESDLRTELSRRRAERLNRTVPIQSARLVQSAFKGVVNEVVKSNAKVNQRHLVKSDEKSNQKEIRRVTVLHRPISKIHDSEEDESTMDSKVPVRFRLGLNKQEARDSKVSRKVSKRQGRKVNHKVNMVVTDSEQLS